MKHISLLFALLITSISIEAKDLTLEQLMTMLASQPRLEAQFKEKKFDSFLEIPIDSSGKVSFIAPDYLEKTIKKPSLQSFILNGDKITVSIRDKEAKTYSIEQRPEIKAFTESFRSTLSGDLKTLREYYDVKLTGQLDQWKLQLKPINKIISRTIETIQFVGQQKHFTQVITNHRNGDYSVMDFFPDKNPDIDNE